MSELLHPKVQASGIFDVICLGATAAVERKFLWPMMGGNKLLGAGVGIIGGGAVTHFLPGKAGMFVGGGGVVNGMLDAADLILGAVGVGDASGSAAPTGESW